ncbi:MAG TPA: universal stress protein [Puia sp.]|nr:universal stress protein [Puia sp.]
MKKEFRILIPTDFSAASRAGMRFAVQWARQQKSRLIFAHVLDVIKFAEWSDSKYAGYTAAQRKLTARRLRSAVGDVMRHRTIGRSGYDAKLVEGAGVNHVLADLTRDKDIDLICMGTNGAGSLQNVSGTRTKKLIFGSAVPVVAVPAGYRSKPIKNILYATDLVDFSGELAEVLDLTRPLGAKITVIHFASVGEVQLDHSLISQVWKKQYGCPIELIYGNMDPTLTLADNLQLAVNRLKPSLLAMFTDRQRTWFQRLLYPSHSGRMSSLSKVPLLVMAKRK